MSRPDAHSGSKLHRRYIEHFHNIVIDIMGSLPLFGASRQVVSQKMLIWYELCGVLIFFHSVQK